MNNHVKLSLNNVQPHDNERNTTTRLDGSVGVGHDNAKLVG